MKKRAISLLLVLLLVPMLCMTVFAVSVPEFTYKDGDTYLGIFKTSNMLDDTKSILKEWLSAPRNALLRSDTGQIHFLIFPVGSTVKASLGANGKVNLLKSGTVDAYGVSWAGRSVNGEFEVCTSVKFMSGGYYSNCTIIGGSLFKELTMPTPVTGYIADITGNLFLEDDGGLFSDSEGGGDGGGNGILDWLKNFWQTLLDFVKSIFVPEDGYFEKWYESIRAKAEKKFSALFALYDILKNAFESENGGSYVGTLMFDIPANHFWSGSPAMSADFFKWVIPFVDGFRWMLTSIIMLFTAIACYRRLVVLFEH